MDISSVSDKPTDSTSAIVDFLCNLALSRERKTAKLHGFSSSIYRDEAPGRTMTRERTALIQLVMVSCLLRAAALLLWLTAASGSLSDDLDLVAGNDGLGKILDNGRLISLSLHNHRSSSFRSKKEYLFGYFSIQIKLVPGNSAGTVTSFYLQSEGQGRDEIDFEFLGNLSGDPYVVHTNIYAKGNGNREQQFFLWFDPTTAFHTYTIIWSPRRILFYVDGTPIREYAVTAPPAEFPAGRPMRVWGSLWGEADWATKGGKVHTDWSKGPFTAYYKNFIVESCRRMSGGATACDELDAAARRKLEWVKRRYMIYNYCTDATRFPRGSPPECRYSRI